MNIFKLFKQEEKGKHMLKAPPSDPKEHEATLLWNRFWGQYDAVMEIACLRQSVNISAEHYEIVEKMFIDTLMELELSAANLVADYRNSKEEKKDGS